MKTIDYKKLENIIDKMIASCLLAKAECSKNNPDFVTVCDNAYEEIGNLLGEAESCIFGDHLRKGDVCL